MNSFSNRRLVFAESHVSARVCAGASRPVAARADRGSTFLLRGFLFGAVSTANDGLYGDRPADRRSLAEHCAQFCAHHQTLPCATA